MGWPLGCRASCVCSPQDKLPDWLPKEPLPTRNNPILPLRNASDVQPKLHPPAKPGTTPRCECAGAVFIQIEQSSAGSLASRCNSSVFFFFLSAGLPHQARDYGFRPIRDGAHRPGKTWAGRWWLHPSICPSLTARCLQSISGIREAETRCQVAETAASSALPLGATPCGQQLHSAL